MENPHWDLNCGQLQGLSFSDNANLPGYSGAGTYFALAEENFALPTPQVLQGAVQNAQFDPGELNQYARDLNEGPRTFGQGPPRRSLPNNGFLYPPLPGTVAQPQITWKQNHVKQDISTLESGYASEKPEIDQTNGWDHPQLQQGFPAFTAGQLSSQYFQNTVSPSIVSDPIADRAHAPPLYRRTRSLKSRSSIPPCPLPSCGKVLKNKSEERKHRLQHQKPYHCEERGCSRADGFATHNDLERHRKSVHDQVPVVGNKDGYICRACPEPSLGVAPKFWPRRDNFRAHIKRKHAHLEEARLVAESQCARPNDAISESGYGSLLGSGHDPLDHQHQHDHSSPSISPLLPQQQVSQPGEANLYAPGGEATFEELAGIGEGPSADQLDADRQSFGIHGPYHELPEFDDPAFATAMGEMMRPADPMMRVPGWPEVHIDLYGATGEHFAQASNPGLMGGDFGSARQDSLIDRPEIVSCKQSDGTFLCPDPVCGKIKKRDCDLRKHMKRHSRPYGCTFPHCWKRFGSRNDWKRHEASQHFLSEGWRCELLLPGGPKCGKLVNNVFDMHHHLGDKHASVLQQATAIRRESTNALLHQWANDMHLGREAHQHFFCGFCNRLIVQGPGTLNAFEERAKHIGDHYDRGDNIDDWVCVEENRPKRCIARLDCQKADQRCGVVGTAEEDSDLGESGIMDQDDPHVSKRRRVVEAVDAEVSLQMDWS